MSQNLPLPRHHHSNCARIRLLAAVIALCAAADAQLLHRYDFEAAGNAGDHVGTAHGMIRGTATVSGGALNTAGAAC